LPTYETKELGLTKKKFELESPDISIVDTATEQADYMRVVMQAISVLYPELEGKLKHITHGMMRFAQGKMSSRLGNVVTGESLLRDSKNMVLEKMADRDFSDVEKNSIAEMVGVAAIKYSILRSTVGSDIIFDFEKSISFEGDSGPYLQYTLVRANSVLEKAKHPSGASASSLWQGSKNADREVFEIEKYLYQFPEVVERALSEYEPHHIATYLIELASSFNSFYANNKIIDDTDESSPYKIALTNSFAKVMQNGLWLLGIKVPEKM
jgi:arginyl-tRNA synthetase